MGLVPIEDVEEAIRMVPPSFEDVLPKARKEIKKQMKIELA